MTPQHLYLIIIIFHMTKKIGIVDMEKNTKEKPKYGLYAGNILVIIEILGFLTIIIFILSFQVSGIMRYILLISGIIGILIFVWPGIGMLLMYIVIFGKLEDNKIPLIAQLESPQILDVGCGTGRTANKIAKLLKNGGHLTGIDIYDKMAIPGNSLYRVQKNARIEGVSDKTTFQYGSVTNIPFDDEKFDMVNASSVLHEVHEEGGVEKSLKEIKRVLKPNGYFMIGEWNRSSWQLILFMGILCFAFKSKKYWDEIFRKSGFKILHHNNKNGFNIYILQKE